MRHPAFLLMMLGPGSRFRPVDPSRQRLVCKYNRAELNHWRSSKSEGWHRDGFPDTTEHGDLGGSWYAQARWRQTVAQPGKPALATSGFEHSAAAVPWPR